MTLAHACFEVPKWSREAVEPHSGVGRTGRGGRARAGAARAGAGAARRAAGVRRRQCRCAAIAARRAQVAPSAARAGQRRAHDPGRRGPAASRPRRHRERADARHQPGGIEAAFGAHLPARPARTARSFHTAGRGARLRRHRSLCRARPGGAAPFQRQRGQPRDRDRHLPRPRWPGAGDRAGRRPAAAARHGELGAAPRRTPAPAGGRRAQRTRPPADAARGAGALSTGAKAPSQRRHQATPIKWLAAPEAHDYPAALAYLTLIFEEAAAEQYVDKLKSAGMASFKAKDIFRASGLSLLGISNAHVERNRAKIDAGKSIAPLLNNGAAVSSG